MIVCHCHQVTERQIRFLVRGGCDSLNEIGRACGAGTGCGGCLPLVCEIAVEATSEGRDLGEPVLSLAEAG